MCVCVGGGTFRVQSHVTLPRVQPVLAHGGRGVRAPHLNQVRHQER